MLRAIKTTVVVGFVSVLLLVVCEAAARWYLFGRPVARQVGLLEVANLFVGAPRYGNRELSQPMFRADPYLGYTLSPGTTVVKSYSGDKSITWTLTADQNGRRITRTAGATCGPKTVYIIGDSFLVGAAVTDTDAVGWKLQSILGDEYCVENLAVGGFGNVQGYLQLARLAASQVKADFVVIGYGQYYRPRNVAASSRMQEYAVIPGAAPWFADLAHARAFLMRGGKIGIDYVSLYRPEYAHLGSSASQLDPPAAYMEAVTEALIDEIINKTIAMGAKPLLAVLTAQDGDAVVAAAKQRGVPIIDLFPLPPEQTDDLMPFDGHPGPKSHSAYATRIAATIAVH